MKKYKTLILDGGTIRKLVGIKEAIGAVEGAFRCFGKGNVQMPPKLYIHLDRHRGDFRAMPAYIEDFESCAIKWVNVHPGNKGRGLPTVMAIIILGDPRNGFPLCVMDGTCATALRTGAAGGVAAKYLARKGSRKIAMVGCGAQARSQLAALREIFDIEGVNAWDLRRASAARFAKETSPVRHPPGYRPVSNGARGIKAAVSDTVRDCVRGCDIVVTTTPSRKPLVRLEWLKGGVHINAIGADARGKQELDPRILKRARVVVDAWEQASHSGEINVPLQKGLLSRKDIYANIGQIVAGVKKPRTRSGEITVFDSTGLAIQDAAIANVIYRKAKRLKKGRYINLIG